ncbi:hypothetical protein ADUPG1_003833, partial [Aduncisulcus paluster]
ETEQAEAWRRVVECLEQKLMLFHPDPEATMVLRTDASTSGVGGMVAMIQDGVEKPLAFYSKKFTDTERKWCTLEQEAFGLYWVMTKARNFLWGRKFVAETDHRNLTFMLKNESAKVQRWRMAVSEFDFEVHHIKGKENLIADGLSRSFVKSVTKISLSDSIKKSQEGFSEDERATLHLEN